jgi:small subunit ribosomal protein S8
MINDPIADMLTRIRNASRAKHANVSFQYSRIKEEILRILKREGFIADFEVQKDGNKRDIIVTLKYFEKQPVIRSIERVSTPGRRIYIKKDDLRPTKNNMGISIVSTSKGVTTGRQAKRLGVGGEVLLRVW